MKSRFTRRQVMGALAASTTLQWAGSAHAAGRDEAVVQTSAPRVRPGAVIILQCPEADAFELVLDDTEPKIYEARGGGLRFRAPGFFAEGPWSHIRCTPLKAGRSIGPPSSVAVYMAFPGYGA